MQASTSPPTVKVVGANGQISLGKQFAGRQVLVEDKEAGVWLIRTATVIPDNERWLHETQAGSDLARALDWSKQHPASDFRNDALLATASTRAAMKSLTYAVDMSLNGEPETARLILGDLFNAKTGFEQLAMLTAKPIALRPYPKPR